MSSFKGTRKNQIRNTLADFYGKKPHYTKDRFFEKMMTLLRSGKKDFLIHSEDIIKLSKAALADEIISIKRVEGIFMVWMANQSERQSFFNEWKKTQNDKNDDILHLKFIKEVKVIWH